jgi:hypothetical protein
MLAKLQFWIETTFGSSLFFALIVLSILTLFW